MIGTRLDKYDVLQKLGEGGMATVYLGRHSTLKRDVAIKVLHPHLSSSQRNRSRFAREARAIEHLRHENILEIYDYSGVDAADCYIITEFVPGETLSVFREEHGALSSEIVTIIGIALARALEYAHSSGILHRDLKPENVMLRRDGEVKLMDFGIARFLNESQVTMTGALVGSPAYMSPEQATERELDQRSDLFSLGTLLFEIATGHLPFTGSNPSLILKKIIDGDRPHVNELSPTLSATLSDTIERLLSTDPSDRHDTATEVCAELIEALTEVDLDASSTEWCLGAFLDDSEGYNRRLQAHIRESLLKNGKKQLTSGEHLKALRLFNRLLSFDDDNDEVLALIQGLHTSPQGASKPRVPWFLAMGTVLAIVIGIATYLVVLRNEAETAPLPPESTTSVPTPEQEVVAAPKVATPPLPEPIAPPAVDAVEPTPEPVADVKRLPKPLRKAPKVLQAPPAPSDSPTQGTPEATEASNPGLLKIAANYPADVYINNERVGTTRDREPIVVTPGSHQLRIASDLIKEHSLTFELAPGEQKEIKVNLQARHTFLDIDTAYPTTCFVTVNGLQVGSLGQIQHRLRIERPDLPHSVRLDCDDQSHVRNWEFMVGTTTFTRP